MAQIDMKNIKNKGTVENIESKEINKSEDIKQAEARQDIAELTDNTQDESKNHKETAEKESTQEQSDKVIVQYVGNGVWKDVKGELWSREDKTGNILSTRQYSLSECNERKDLEFMARYGEIKVTHVRG